jgi:hypothetical protein
MKKVFLLGGAMSILFGACKKDDNNSRVSNVKNRSTAMCTNTNPRANLDLIIQVNSKDKSYASCPNPGAACYKSNGKLIDCQETLQCLRGTLDAVQKDGNGNKIFSKDGWDILFEEVKHHEGLLEAINANKYFLYQLALEDEGQPEQYSFVLSSATSVAKVNSDNSLLAWQF